MSTQTRVVVATFLAASVLLIGFTVYRAFGTSTGEGVADTLAPAETTEIDATGGSIDFGAVRLTAPAGAIADDDIAVVAIAEVPPARDGIQFGQPVGIEHQQELRGPVEVRWDISQLDERQRAGITLTRWDEDLEVWRYDEIAHRTPYSVDGDELVVTTHEFSFWSWVADIGQEIGELTGSRVDPPECNDGEPHDWVDGVLRPNEDTNAAAVLVCYERDRDEVMTMRVANNRVFAQRLKLTDGDQDWHWTWNGDTDISLSGLVYEVSHHVFDDGRNFLLPPTHEVAVGIDRADTPGPSYVQFTGTVDEVTLLTDVVAYGAEQIGPVGSAAPALRAAIEVLLNCTGDSAFGGWAGDAQTTIATILDALIDCVGLLIDPDSAVREVYTDIAVRNMDAGNNKAAFESANLRIVNGLRLFKILQIGELAFYASDQLANAAVGDLTWSIRGRGRAQELGEWAPTCDDAAVDSNRLFRNLALRDEFADTSYDYWQFDLWAPYADRAVVALDDCTDQYVAEIAEVVRRGWGDPIAADVVAASISRLLPKDLPTSTDELAGETFEDPFYDEGTFVMRSLDVGNGFTIQAAERAYNNDAGTLSLRRSDASDVAQLGPNEILLNAVVEFYTGDLIPAGHVVYRYDAASNVWRVAWFIDRFSVRDALVDDPSLAAATGGIDVLPTLDFISLSTTSGTLEFTAVFRALNFFGEYETLWEGNISCTVTDTTTCA